MKPNKTSVVGMLIMLLSFLSFTQGHAQLVATSGQTAAALAAALAGPGIVVSNATLTCPSVANGTFSGGSSTTNLGINNGIVLTSGRVNPGGTGVFGATNTDGDFASNSNAAGGDADLSLLAGVSTNDACVLQFDFVPNGDKVSFHYQFGSEEYPNFTCTQFNDVFGFFISGPGYSGPTNIALVPGTSIPVAINSVNGGSATGNGNIATCNGMGPGSPFPAYFINNVGHGAPVYDGMTKVLTASANVTPCATYHLKLGVADGSDFILDSGVFLESGSLTINPPTIVGCPSDISVGTGPGATSCGTTVNWTPPTADNSCLNVTVSSNHSPGDFFPTGTTTVTYTFTNAGGSSTCSFNVTVTDNTPPVAVCQNYTATLVNGTVTVTPANVDGGSHDNCPGMTLVSVTPNTFTCADAGTTIPVTLVVMDAQGLTNSCVANVTVDGVVPSCNISVVPCNTVYTGGIPTNLYLGYGPQCATMTSNATGGSSFTYSWSGPTSYLSCTNCQSPVFTPTIGGTYVFTSTVTNNYGCSSTCTVTFCVKDIRVPGQTGKVYLCHSPNGNGTNLQNLSISVNAVPSHLGMHSGDVLGQCGQTCGAVVPNARQAFITSNNMSNPDLQVMAYPNPFTEGLHLQVLSNVYDAVQITVMDLSGRKLEILQSQPTRTDLTVGTRLAPGIYMVEVKNGDASTQVKVVKTK
jgi:hypothetical protein